MTLRFQEFCRIMSDARSQEPPKRNNSRQIHDRSTVWYLFELATRFPKAMATVKGSPKDTKERSEALVAETRCP
jgi:hypothetical protein